MSIEVKFNNKKEAANFFLNVIKAKIDEINKVSPEIIHDITYSTANEMQSFVKSHKKRTGMKATPTEPIERNLIAEKELNGLHCGIGNLNKLQQESPHWYVINYGKTQGGQSYIPNWGRYVRGLFNGMYAPNSSGGNNQFIPSKDGLLMSPRKAIQPMNYIEYGISTFSLLLKNFHFFLNQRMGKK